MDKQELEKLAPDLLKALKELYKAHEETMIAEYVTWSPEESGEPAVINAKRLIDLADK
ncbi:hypothetical protein KIH13_12365 [Pseudomonas viridiflava]|nr:hypothetical protein KIH13_12365 [Pseudomonas viridiflava]